MLKQIGAVIAAERARRGLGSHQLDVDPRVVEATEAGQPGITTTQLATIAEALQLDLPALRSGIARIGLLREGR